MATVTLRNVEKRYGKNGVVTAVEDASLEIADGEFLVLVGPSGCGKSTLLRMIGGLEEITSGSIYVDNKLINDVPPRNRNMAMVFQNYALYPQMTVFDNMAFSMKLARASKSDIHARVTEAARMLKLEALLDRRPSQLSGGQRQRVALGRAIVRKPGVFLMDEPLSNLDAKLRLQMRTELIKLHQTIAATTVYVTHDQVEAMTMGERIVVMRDGKIQQDDRPSVVYSTPENTFVGGFIGSPPMLFINGRLLRSSDGAAAAHMLGRSFDLPDWFRPLLAQADGREVVFGVRPEHVHLAGERKPGSIDVAVEGEVTLVESVGSEAHVYLEASGCSLAARTLNAQLTPAPGSRVRVTIDLEHLHVFDPVTEESLSADIRKRRRSEVATV